VFGGLCEKSVLILISRKGAKDAKETENNTFWGKSLKPNSGLSLVFLCVLGGLCAKPVFKSCHPVVRLQYGLFHSLSIPLRN
jgi:hypothetical protein